MPIKLDYARSAQDLALFTRHLSGAMMARAPLAEVLGSFSEEADTAGMQRAVQDMVPRLESGASLSDVLADHPQIFPLAYRRAIQMGEESGALPKVVEDLASTLEDSIAMNENFRRATIYPAVILLFLFVFTLFISTQLFPKFVDIYSQLGATLPDLSRFTYSSTLPLFLMVTLLLVCVLWILGAGAGLVWQSYRHGKWMLSLPLVGPALRLAETARFVRHLGLMLENRVPLNEAVNMLADSSGNLYVRRALKDFAARLEEGESLGDIIAHQPLFPRPLALMLASAQERGQLAETLERMAGFYRQRAEHALRVIREFFEPLVLVLLGFLVAWLALAMYLPLLTFAGQMPYGIG